MLLLIVGRIINRGASDPAVISALPAVISALENSTFRIESIQGFDLVGPDMNPQANSDEGPELQQPSEQPGGVVEPGEFVQPIEPAEPFAFPDPDAGSQPQLGEDSNLQDSPDLRVHDTSPLAVLDEASKLQPPPEQPGQIIENAESLWDGHYPDTNLDYGELNTGPKPQLGEDISTPPDPDPADRDD